MSKVIPDWAIRRAAEEEEKVTASLPYNRCQMAFARYIMEHEEEPVDPLLEEAREICAEEIGPNKAYQCRNGDRDGYIETRTALAALKRGIELGKGGAS